MRPQYELVSSANAPPPPRPGTMLPDEQQADVDVGLYDSALHRSTLWKLDCLLLPFLALLFLFNSLDKANVRSSPSSPLPRPRLIAD